MCTLYNIYGKFVYIIRYSVFRVQALKNPLPGTKTQNDLAIKEVLKLVDENNEEKNEARKRDVKQNSQEAVEIVTYSTDILEKYVTKKVCLGANKVRTYFGSFFFFFIL